MSLSFQIETFFTICLALTIFGYLIGSRPRLPVGWRWLGKDNGKFIILENDKHYEAIKIEQTSSNSWQIGEFYHFTKLSDAKKAALRMVS